MKVLFVDQQPNPIDALETAPLGGSQSALMAAAFELEQSGATVVIAGKWTSEGEYRGVHFVDISRLARGAFADVDAVVTLNRLLSPADFKASFGARTRLIHWHQNDALTTYGKNFARRDFYKHVDRLVFCSHFQASSFLSLHGLPPDRVSVISNPISSPFCNLFAEDQSILGEKDPDLLVYISAPNRGLDGLLQVIFPNLRNERRNLRLEVFSGFYLDQGIRYAGESGDSTEYFEDLLRTHHSPPVVSVHRGVPKNVLARRLREAAMLCYPCTYPETSCTAALEAMAAGCQLSTTTIGAMPETTAGFAWLTANEPDGLLSAKTYIATTLTALSERVSRPDALEVRLRNQVEHVNRSHSTRSMGHRWRCLLDCEIAQRPRPD